MAGGGGSTGGIGAQSPAVNPPSPMGQAGNAIAGQIGNTVGGAFGGAQQPIPAYRQPMFPTGQFGAQPIPVGNNQMPQVDPGFGYIPGMQQAGQQPLPPDMMAALQQQTAGLGGLAAFLGGSPMPPTSTTQPRPAPAMSPNPGRPVRTDQPTPVETKPSVVPPKTPPAVANAIQKLAAKNQARMQ